MKIKVGVMINWDNYRNFNAAEFACQETGEHGIEKELLDRLQRMRDLYGKPMIVTSGYRSPRHSIEARKEKPGPHTTGLAVDIRCDGPDCYQLMKLAFTLGFTGIGVSQKAGGPRFLHLDLCDRKSVWSY